MRHSGLFITAFVAFLAVGVLYGAPVYAAPLDIKVPENWVLVQVAPMQNGELRRYVPEGNDSASGVVLIVSSMNVSASEGMREIVETLMKDGFVSHGTITSVDGLLCTTRLRGKDQKSGLLTDTVVGMRVAADSSGKTLLVVMSTTLNDSSRIRLESQAQTVLRNSTLAKR